MIPKIGIFKEQLKFEFLKKINIHLNLGTYWTDDKKVIGNTQQLADFLAVESMFDPKLKEKTINGLSDRIICFIN